MASTLPTSEKLVTRRFAFPEEVVEKYTNGDCAVLAATIESLTGWPIWVCFSEILESVGDATHIDWMHAFVMTPDGRCLDIEGHWHPDDLMCQWDNLYDRYAIESGIMPIPVEDRADIDRAGDTTRQWAATLIEMASTLPTSEGRDR